MYVMGSDKEEKRTSQGIYDYHLPEKRSSIGLLGA